MGLQGLCHCQIAVCNGGGGNHQGVPEEDGGCGGGEQQQEEAEEEGGQGDQGRVQPRGGGIVEEGGEEVGGVGAVAGAEVGHHNGNIGAHCRGCVENVWIGGIWKSSEMIITWK